MSTLDGTIPFIQMHGSPMIVSKHLLWRRYNCDHEDLFILSEWSVILTYPPTYLLTYLPILPTYPTSLPTHLSTYLPAVQYVLNLLTTSQSTFGPFRKTSGPLFDMLAIPTSLPPSLRTHLRPYLPTHPTDLPTHLQFNMS